MIVGIRSWFQLRATATNWAVADRNVATDVSNHVGLLSDVSNIANNRTCSNLF